MFNGGRTRRNATAALVLVTAAGLCLVSVGVAAATGSTLFDQTFKNNTTSGTGSVKLPAETAGTNQACLTASGGSTAPLVSCASTTDTNGSGAMRLTDTSNNKVGAVFAATSVPTTAGLDITFNLNQYGTIGNPADGIAFVLAAVDPTNPQSPTNAGPNGGSLGYAGTSTTNGLTYGYLGIGFDVYGNYSTIAKQGTGCGTAPPYINTVNTKVPGQVVVKGPGNGTVGYCPLTSTASSATNPPVVALHSAVSTRPTTTVPVEVSINPTASALTNTGGISVAAGTYRVDFTAVDGAAKSLSGTLPTASTFPASWLTSANIPKQLAFGWTGSTGGSVDNHEVTNARVASFSPVAQLTASQTSYTATTGTLAQGSAVTYQVTSGVAPSVDEAGPVSVTDTLPTGVLPQGGFGTGWVCAAPSGQSITCTNSTGPFTAGATLPALTITGTVTGTTVTSGQVQANSVVTNSSANGLPGYSNGTATGTPPTAPAVTSISPNSGSAAGGDSAVITGTDLNGATTVQIGTTAEINAGTATTLGLCTDVVTSGCFTLTGSTTINIAAMPAHAVGAVVAQVTTLGVSGTVGYTYVTTPAAPVVTATAGVRSAAVSWIAPANRGSTIISYTLSTYLAGSLIGTPTTGISAAATTTTVSSLTAGGSYTFTVAAVNANGTGAPGTSNVAVPYTVPDAPTAASVTAGTGTAAVSWVAPVSNGFSAITGYTVTPYLAGVAQTAQMFASTLTAQTVTGLTAGSTYTFTVQSTNAAGTGAPSSATSPVTINAAPTLAFSAPGDGEVGVSYTNTLVVTGGTGPYVWSVNSGSLPAGLSLTASTGVISGTPTTAGTANFVIKVVDASGANATQSTGITIVAVPSLTNAAPPNGEVGVSYSDGLAVTGGTGPFEWSISAGTLPAGLTLNSLTGVISGAPTTAGGPVNFTVQVTDALGQVATQALSTTIIAAPSLSFPAPTAGEVGVAYTDQLVVTGGTSPFTWAVTTGTLPAGLTLSSAGLLSGTPSAVASRQVTIGVTDNAGQTATQPITVTIVAVPSLTFTPPAGEVNVAYTAAPARTGGTAGFTWSIQTGTLPPGLTLNTATGAITGTPSAAGSSPLTVRVVDTFGKTATAAGTIVIVAVPTLANAAAPTGVVGTAYTDQLAVTGGTSGYSWTVSTGSLPPGVTLGGSTGLLSGTPTTAGSYSYTVLVTDANEKTASQSFTSLIKAISAVALVSSTASTTVGGSVIFTATLTPTASTGLVTFTDAITSGPSSGTQTVVGTGLVGPDGTVAVTTTLAALGSHSVTAAYEGDGTHSTASSTPAVVAIDASLGDVIVKEFRQSGPSGGNDSYAELYNPTITSVTLAGYAIISGSGSVTTLPSTTPALGAHRSYLVSGSAFSLASSVATPDYQSSGLGSSGIQIVAPDPAATVTDAVGPNTTGFHTGTPLPAMTSTLTANYAWVRIQTTGSPKNTQSNAADFALVSISGGSVGGVTSMLGSPSPTGSADPYQLTASLKSTLLDPSKAGSVAPNRVITTGPPKTLTVSRTITNTTGATISAMKLRLISLSEANGVSQGGDPGLGGTNAHLRATNPLTATSTVQVGGTNVTVRNLSVASPSVAIVGGGLNTTLVVPLGGGLAQNATVSVKFTFTADAGGSYWLVYDVDAK